MYAIPTSRAALLGGAPTGPLALPGLLLWLDSAKGLYQDNAGATRAAADADPVGLWQDQSGLGNHALSTLDAKRPILKLNIKSAQPVVRFDGTDDFLQIVSNTGLNPTTITLAMVVFPTSFVSLPVYFGKSGSYDLLSQATGTLKVDYPAVIASAGGAVVVSTWYLLEYVFDLSNQYIYRNTVQVATGVSVTPLANNANVLQIGAFTATEPLAGDVAEAVIYGRALAAAERAQLEAYFNRRWSIY